MNRMLFCIIETKMCKDEIVFKIFVNSKFRSQKRVKTQFHLILILFLNSILTDKMPHIIDFDAFHLFLCFSIRLS